MIETTIDGRYQILARVAAGGMGEVFRAHDPVLNREVALKMLHPSLAGDADFIDRFRREARSAAMLSHPNIVAVHDWGSAGETYFMVMEYVRGANLRTLLLRTGPLLPAQAAEVVGQVLSALGHAHRQGIVHRDVKPENILVTGEGVAKVADFGLARALAESRVSQAPGTVTGTVQYLAPEQIQGEPADPRTDLYATGIVLFELLAGRVPYTGETSVAIAYKHLRDRVPPPSRSNPMVPASLDSVVLRATEKGRDQRTPDAEAMRKEIAAAAADLPPAPPLAELVKKVPPAEDVSPDRARTVTIPRTLSPKARRRRVLGRLLTTLAILVLLAAAGWGVWTYVVPHRTEVPGLRGLTVGQAQRRADAAGLDLVVARQEFSSTVAANLIIRQVPSPGEEVERGTEIAVVLSRGPELIRVPDVEGEPVARARGALEEAGFEPAVTRVFSGEVEVGVVIEQNPASGNAIEVGSTVRLTVSKGPQPVSVPEVVGRGAGEAEEILETAGLQVSSSRQFHDEIPAGNVISQEPEAGASVEPGTTVSIVVSRGPRAVDVPDLIGMSEEAAKEELEELGLRTRVVRLPNSSGDSVVAQDPAEGERVRIGEQVTVYIGGR